MHFAVRTSNVVLLFVVLALILSGCGTTHHFLPPQPLESGKWEIQVTWHADLNGVHNPWRSVFIPEVSAYLGVGRNWNFGFGGYAPIPLLHASIARYYSQGDRDFMSAYVHFQPLLRTTYNPQLELGLNYNIRRGKHANQIGFAFGVYEPSPLGLDYMRSAARHGPYPILKYSYFNRDFGLSWAHYFNKTRSNVELSLGANMKILDVASDQIDSITSFDNGFRAQGYTIFLKDSTEMSFYLWQPYADAFGQIPEIEFRDWLDPDAAIYYLEDPQTNIRTEVYLSFDDVLSAYNKGDRVTINRVSDRVYDRIRGIKSFKDDNTIGISAFAHP